MSLHYPLSVLYSLKTQISSYQITSSTQHDHIWPDYNLPNFIWNAYFCNLIFCLMAKAMTPNFWRSYITAGELLCQIFSQGMGYNWTYQLLNNQLFQRRHFYNISSCQLAWLNLRVIFCIDEICITNFGWQHLWKTERTLKQPFYVVYKASSDNIFSTTISVSCKTIYFILFPRKCNFFSASIT